MEKRLTRKTGRELPQNKQTFQYLKYPTYKDLNNSLTEIEALIEEYSQNDAGLLPENNLSDVASASTARTNLGLGTLATQDGDVELLEKQTAQVIIGSLDNALTAGTNKGLWIAPYDGTITDIFGDLLVAQSTGSLFQIDINKNGTTILSTKLTFDNNETTTTTATTPKVISSTTFSQGDRFTFDLDVVGDSVSRGPLVTILYKNR
jgi:hypothetical protein